MDQRNRRGWTQRRLIGSFAALALVLVLLAACGHGTSNSANSETTNSANNGSTSNAQTSSTNNNTTTGSGNSANMNAACDQMTKVIISEHATPGKADQYAFTPDHVTIKTGEFITFSNQSDEIHVLVATPAAALADSAIDRSEDQPVQFTKTGTYTLESQDAKHRATMQVTVSAIAGTTCGISAPSTTVTFTAKHTPGQAESYTLAPNTVSINAGQSLILENKSTQALNFSCKPSADLMEGNLRVDTNEQQVVQFAKAGQYTCTNTESPRSTVMVNVH
jgi:plastocyanin